MTLAFDAVSTSGTNPRTGDFAWTHTPVGAPGAILVMIVGTAASDPGVVVTYGRVTMPTPSGLTVDPPVSRTAGDQGTLYTFLLGSDVPSGPQTVSVFRAGSPAAWMGAAVSMTATTALVAVVDGNNSSGSTANATAPLDAGTSALLFGAVAHDGAAVSAIGPGTVLDTTVIEVDFGVQVGGIYRSSVAHSGVVSADIVCDAAGRIFYPVAVAEISGDVLAVPPAHEALVTVPTPLVVGDVDVSVIPTTVVAIGAVPSTAPTSPSVSVTPTTVASQASLVDGWSNTVSVTTLIPPATVAAVVTIPAPDVTTAPTTNASASLSATATISASAQGSNIHAASAALSAIARITVGTGFKVYNVDAVATSPTTVSLRWDDVPSLIGEEFDVERNGVVIARVATTSYVDTGLSPNTTYTYRVRAVK